jgi:hypothetical protein
LALLRKHRKSLVVIGAAIVFLTFFLKEGLRENLKEEINRIEVARKEFEAKQDARLYLNKILEGSGNTGREGRRETFAQIAHPTEIQVLDQFHDNIGDDLSYLLQQSSELVSLLPENAHRDEQKKQTTSHIEVSNHAGDEVNRKFAIYSTSSKPASEEQKRAYSDYQLRYRRAYDAVEGYFAIVREEAIEEEENKRHWLSIYTYILYALPVVGLAVNVTGSLLEPEQHFEIGTPGMG